MISIEVIEIDSYKKVFLFSFEFGWLSKDFVLTYPDSSGKPSINQHNQSINHHFIHHPSSHQCDSNMCSRNVTVEIQMKMVKRTYYFLCN